MEITSIKIKLSNLKGVLGLTHVSSRKHSLFTESYLKVNEFPKIKQGCNQNIEASKPNKKQLKRCTKDAEIVCCCVAACWSEEDWEPLWNEAPALN
jgi:hypothetical protein